MATTTLPALLCTLTEAIESASSSLVEEERLAPPSDGISLLDTRNELFLSYLQNLVFLIILKLRNTRSETTEDKQDAFSDSNAEIVKRLVELRVYLEKGVKPLENRLRYQIDKVVRAADDALLKEAANELSINGKTKKSSVKTRGKDPNAISASDSDASDEEDDEANANAIGRIDPLSYRPNPSAFTRSEAPSKDNSGAYRPPKINPVSLPITEARAPRAERMAKSHTLDEFVTNELSSAPRAMPSIGSTITHGGRRNKSDKERRDEAERRTYEETNFVRLPALSKKDKQKEGKKYEGWGGEDWRELGAGADRVSGLVGRKKGGGVLERSRKREREDVGGDSGLKDMSERWEKRRKRVAGRSKR